MGYYAPKLLITKGLVLSTEVSDLSAFGWGPIFAWYWIEDPALGGLVWGVDLPRLRRGQGKGASKEPYYFSFFKYVAVLPFWLIQIRISGNA